MKLFKKLAAAVLVAALALTMVGCGGSNSLLDQVKNVIADVYAMKDEELTNKKELDELAAKLVAEAKPFVMDSLGVRFWICLPIMQS